MCNRSYDSRSSSWDDIELLEIIDPSAPPHPFRAHQNKEALFDMMLSSRGQDIFTNKDVCQDVKQVLNLKGWTDIQLYKLLFIYAGKTILQLLLIMHFNVTLAGLRSEIADIIITFYEDELDYQQVFQKQPQTAEEGT